MTTPATKADEIALYLEERIITGELAPGTVLRQDRLSDEFAVSRTPVREALRQLVALDLASFVPNRGVRVRTFEPREIEEAFMVRAELEGLAAYRAASRMTEADFLHLRHAEAKFAELTVQLTDGTANTNEIRQARVDWVHANHQFHDVILQAAQLPLLERYAKSTRWAYQGQAFWPTSPIIDELYHLNVLQHEGIRVALEARSEAGARALATDHLLTSGRLLRTILESVMDERRRRRTRSTATQPTSSQQ